jgi:uncharacterized cupin superfamily protein
MRDPSQAWDGGTRGDEEICRSESLPELGVELPSNWRSDALSYEPYTECGSGRQVGAVHWLQTVDPRTKAGIWRLDPGLDEPVKFAGYETFQILDGYAEVVAKRLVMMTLQPGDTGSIPSGLLTEWWIAPPLVKLFVVGGGGVGGNDPGG